MRVSFLTLTDTLASEKLYGRALSDALETEGVQIVDNWSEADIVHLFEVNFFTRDAIKSFNLPQLLRILRSEVAVVVSTDDLYFTGRPSFTARPWLYGINHFTQKHLLRRCDAVIAISHSVKDALAPYFDNTPIHVVHHGVSDRYFTDVESSHDPFILHVSLASKRKNPGAISGVAQSIDHRFVIAGGGWKSKLSDAARNHVELTGFLPEEDLIELYQSAGIFYFPTYHEGFGLPLLEAMASGNAIVTSDAYAVPEVVGDVAILHHPDDVEAHIDSLQMLLNDQQKRGELSEAARKRARTFTWKKCANRTIEVYQSVIND